MRLGYNNLKKKIRRTRRIWKVWFVKHFLLFSFVYIFINLFFNRYIQVVFYLVYITFFFFNKNPKVQKYLANKRKNDMNLMHHYRKDYYFNIIYIFTRGVYTLVFISFIFQGGVPFLKNHSTYTFGLLLFSLCLDFFACFYIIRYLNVPSRVRYLIETFGPKTLTMLTVGYSGYAVTNPTHEFSHFYHRHGPRFFGSMGCVAHTDLQLQYYDHIRTVDHTANIDIYLSHDGVISLSVIKYRIHTDPLLYSKWRAEIPMNLWNIYGLDKNYGEGLTKFDLDDLKYKGILCKADVLYEIKRKN